MAAMAFSAGGPTVVEDAVDVRGDLAARLERVPPDPLGAASGRDDLPGRRGAGHLTASCPALPVAPSTSTRAPGSKSIRLRSAIQADMAGFIPAAIAPEVRAGGQRHAAAAVDERVSAIAPSGVGQDEYRSSPSLVRPTPSMPGISGSSSVLVLWLPPPERTRGCRPGRALDEASSSPGSGVGKASSRGGIEGTDDGGVLAKTPGSSYTNHLACHELRQ